MSGLANPAQDSGSETRGDDFIDSFQLPVSIESSYVEHTYRYTDVARGIRNATRVERWSRSPELGRGGFGTVYLETETKGSVRAVKEVPKRAGRGKTMDFLREVLAMAHFSKEEACFVKLLGWYQTKAHIYIAMEYFPEGDLFARVVQPIPEAEVQRISQQLLEGLDFMHRKNFAHRDLKPSNILVVTTAPHWWVKIGDFGVSKRVKNDARTMHTSIQTDYTAPEVLGLVEDENDVLFIHALLRPHPRDRMTSHNAMSHEWLQEVVLKTSRPHSSIGSDRDEGQITAQARKGPSPNIENLALDHSSTVMDKVDSKLDPTSSPASLRNPHLSLPRTLPAQRSGNAGVAVSEIHSGSNSSSTVSLPSQEPDAFERSVSDPFPPYSNPETRVYKIKVKHILIEGLEDSTFAEGEVQQGPPDTFVRLEVDGREVGSTRTAMGLWRPRWDHRIIVNVRKNSVLWFRVFASSKPSLMRNGELDGSYICLGETSIYMGQVFHSLTSDVGGDERTSKELTIRLQIRPAQGTGFPLVGHGFPYGWEKRWTKRCDKNRRVYYMDRWGTTQRNPPEATQQEVPQHTHRKSPTSTQVDIVNPPYQIPRATATGPAHQIPKGLLNPTEAASRIAAARLEMEKSLQPTQKKPPKSPHGKKPEPGKLQSPKPTQQKRPESKQRKPSDSTRRKSSEPKNGIGKSLMKFMDFTSTGISPRNGNRGGTN
ncbi:MAG: hypothetical protein Q9174_003897 [Haloplaca sp. 1 TL-2023]